MKQRAFVVALHGGEAAAKDKPLFPARSGSAFAKKGWAAAVRRISEDHETEAEKDARGARLVKGHSARRGGAQLLARSWPLFVVQVFGRWGSDAIRGYVEDAPLEGAPVLAAGAMAQWSCARARREMRRGPEGGQIVAALGGCGASFRAAVLTALGHDPTEAELASSCSSE